MLWRRRSRTKDLAPFLRELRPLVEESRPTIRDLSTLVSRPGNDNDLTDATRKFPALASSAAPAFNASRQALQGAQPVLEFLRPYAPELVGWLRDFGQSAANYDANGHFARVQRSSTRSATPRTRRRRAVADPPVRALQRAP